MKVKRWLTEHHNTAQLIMRGNVTPEVQMDWKIEYFSEVMHIVENKWHYALFFLPRSKTALQKYSQMTFRSAIRDKTVTHGDLLK